MIQEDLIFTPRGEKDCTIKFKGHEVKIKIKVLTNREIDQLFEEFSSYDEVTGEYKTDATSLISERVVKCLLDINTTFKGKNWTDLTIEEKREAVDLMNKGLREQITKHIIAENSLEKEEKDFL